MSTSAFKGSEYARLRSRVATAARTGSAEDLVSARRDLAEEKLRSYIEKTVAQAPPLTPEQCDRLATLLRPADDGSGGGPDAA